MCVFSRRGVEWFVCLFLFPSFFSGDSTPGYEVRITGKSVTWVFTPNHLDFVVLFDFYLFLFIYLTPSQPGRLYG